MICLPDVNVWVALTVAEHIHHKIAIEWSRGDEWANLSFCRVTQSGFLRLLTNKHVMGASVMDYDSAWHTLDGVRRSRAVTFMDEPPDLEEKWRMLTLGKAAQANLWTDCYLAAFAELTGCMLVTFDRGFSAYKKTSVRILS